MFPFSGERVVGALLRNV